ncbi:MAG: hypothetical protein HY000_11380 [Planctomycetes bacterium]|nr:hypothetical protein [Planctomycetota bacterium]
MCFAQSPAPLVSNDPDVTQRTPEAARDANTRSVRRALIICGLAGDAEHRELFAGTLESIHAGLTTRLGFAAENVRVLWGDEPTDEDPAAVRASRSVAGRETITQAAEALRGELQPDDVLWVFVLGHAYYDGRHSWLNVGGPDLHQIELGQLFGGVQCREQVFLITTPCSGFFLKPLAMPGRIVISATEPDLEVNETLFPYKLAEAFSSPPPAGEIDLDQDQRVTLLDLYLWTARETAQQYATDELLATEHALLDDSGDGRGTEIQADYLPEELGGRRRANRPPPPLAGDGKLAQQIVLPWIEK